MILLKPNRKARHFKDVVYYESIKRELNIRLTYECRCDERLKAKAEGSTRLAYTGFRGGLEHLKIETRLIDERFPSVMGECVIVTLKVCRLYSAKIENREF
jgi:hypothetical protein